MPVGVVVAVPVSRPAVVVAAPVVMVVGVVVVRGVNVIMAVIIAVVMAMAVVGVVAVSGVRRPVLGCGVGLAHGRRVPFRLGASAGRAVGHRPSLASIMCI